MTYMQDALQVFTEPCSIYEWPSLDWVAINQAGEEWRKIAGIKPEGEPGGNWVGYWTGLSPEEIRARIDADPDDHLKVVTEWGIIHATLVPQLHGRLPRPTLLLCSAHPVAEDPARSRETHITMRLVMIAFEVADVTTALLETVQDQVTVVAEVLGGTKRLLTEEVEKISQTNSD